MNITRGLQIAFAIHNAGVRRSRREYAAHPLMDGRLGPKIPERPDGKPATCERPTCDRGPYRRGLCTVHYRHQLRVEKAAK